MNLERRRVFDTVAELYDHSRPGYPDALVERLLQLASPDHDAPVKVLEIACGTGQATRLFADRGCEVDAVELGENLSSIARQKFVDHPGVRIFHSNFETWEGADKTYDLAICATAFHWLDPEIAIPQMVRFLKPGAVIALFWNMQPLDMQDKAFTLAVDVLYQKHRKEPNPRPWPRSTEEQVQAHKERLDFPQWVGEVTIERFPWSKTYTTDDYIELISTYSPHLLMEEEVRKGFLAGMRELVDSRGGSITRQYLATVFWAKTHSGK